MLPWAFESKRASSVNQTDSRNSHIFRTVWHYLVNLQTFGILFCHLCQKWCSSATCSQKTSWGDNISVKTFTNCFHITNCVVAVIMGDFSSWMFWSLNSHWFFLSELTLYLKGLRLNNSWKSSSRFTRIFGIPPFALHYEICKVMQKLHFVEEF